MAQSGDWHVVMACRDFAKAEKEARKLGMPKGSYTVMHLDLASLESVRQFVQNFKNRWVGARGGCLEGPPRPAPPLKACVCLWGDHHPQ